MMADIRGQFMTDMDRLDNPAPKGSSGNGYHSLEDFRWVVDDRMARHAFNQHPKHVAHIAAMKAKGIWPKDLEDENIRPAEDVE